KEETHAASSIPFDEEEHETDAHRQTVKAIVPADDQAARQRWAEAAQGGGSVGLPYRGRCLLGRGPVPAQVPIGSPRRWRYGSAGGRYDHVNGRGLRSTPLELHGLRVVVRARGSGFLADPR